MSEQTLWHKSSYSSTGGGDCVEVAESSEGAKVRDTQNRDLGHLDFGSEQWTSLLALVR